MSDIIISNTLKLQCATDEWEILQTKCEGGSGHGIGSYGGAQIIMEKFVVTENEFIGVQIAHGSEDGVSFEKSGEIKLKNGIISYNKVGANIQSESSNYFNTFENNIFWSGNTSNYSGDNLIVPETGDIDISDLPDVD